MEKNFWKGLLQQDHKKMRSNVFLVFLLGVMLLTAGKSISVLGTTQKEAAVQVHETESMLGTDAQTEKRMAELLSKIEGAGQVDVMLTYRKTEEKTVAEEEMREESYTEENGKKAETLRTEKVVVLTEDGKGSSSPVVLSASFPEVEGVVIVAQGGHDPKVCSALNQAAQALLDVPAHKIAVLKMK